VSTASTSSLMRNIDLTHLRALGGVGSEDTRAARTAEIQAQMERLIEELKLPPAGRNYVLQTIVGSPTQKMRHNTKAVQVTFPSRKMGASLALMGRTGEAAHALRMELDSGVGAYYMHPSAFPAEIRAEDGTLQTRTMITPDALVMRNDLRVVEFRDEATLLARSIKSPYQFYQDDDSGRWHYRAAEEAIAATGLKYEIITNQSLPATLLDNVRFLEDYCRSDCTPLDHQTARQLVLAVHSHQFASLRELIAEGFKADDIYQAIVAGLVYVDLERTRLDRPAGVHIYPSEKIADVHEALQRSTNVAAPPIAGVAAIAPGTIIRFKDGTTYRVEVPGEVDVQVRGEDGVLAIFPLNKLLSGNDKTIELISPPNGAASDALSRRTTKEVEDAVDRLTRIETKLQAGQALSRTERRYHQRVRGIHGRIDQVIACLDSNRDKGNTTKRLPPLSEAYAESVIKSNYNVANKPTAKSVYRLYCEKCDSEANLKGEPIPAMSYRAFLKRVSLWKDAVAREGEKAAYQTTPLVLSLQNAYPRHGSYAHECLYIDSTVVNMQTLAPSGVGLGKFTMTLGIDGATHQGRCLVFSYDKAGRWTFFLAVRDYVRRHGRLPKTICVDNGPEFKNHDVITFCALFGIDIIWRKPGEPRGGAMIESLIGVTEKMVIQNLEGNTIAMKNPRSVSPRTNGFNHGKYDLLDLYRKMEKFIFEERNRTSLPSIGATPDELEEALRRERGERPVKAAALNSDFMLMTSPHPRGRTRKYDQIKGVFVDGRRFRAPEMKQLKHGASIEVRVEGWMARVVYVMIDRKWRIAVCNHPDLANHTRREDELAVKALHRQGTARRYKEDKRSAGREVPPGAVKYSETERLRQESNRQVAQYQFGQIYAMAETAELLDRLGAPVINDYREAAAQQVAEEVAADGTKNPPGAGKATVSTQSTPSEATETPAQQPTSEPPQENGKDAVDFLAGSRGYR
jgi:putative transposase